MVVTQPRKLDSSSVFLSLPPYPPADHPVLPALLPEHFPHRLTFTSVVAAAVQTVSILSSEHLCLALTSLSPLSTHHTEMSMGQHRVRISHRLCPSEQKHKLRRMASARGTSGSISCSLHFVSYSLESSNPGLLGWCHRALSLCSSCFLLALDCILLSFCDDLEHPPRLSTLE